MRYFVYTVIDEGPKMTERLIEKGYEVYIGNGTLEDEPLTKCDALVPGKCHIGDEELNKAKNLKIISKFGVGYEKIDVDACTRHHVILTNTPLSNFISVAEHTIALMFAAAKRICEVQTVFHTEKPDWNAAKKMKSIELNGKTLTVVGLGNIGRKVAEMAHLLGMEIVGYDPYVKEADKLSYVTYIDDLNTALSKGDIISIHVSGGESVRNLINKKTIVSMKDGTIFINTTRGLTVNEADLYDALVSGKIGCAALDVFAEEPVTKPNPLLTLPNVIATPHNGANTPEANIRSQYYCAENIIDVLEGRAPKTPINHI